MAADGSKWEVPYPASLWREMSQDVDQATVCPDQAQLEQAFLGAVLNNPAVLESLPDGFGAQHLVVEGHADIFEAAVAAKEGGAVLLLQEVQKLIPESVVDHAYIRSLCGAAISNMPSHAAGIAAQIMDAESRRALLRLSASIRDMVLADDRRRPPTPAILTQATDGLDRIVAAQREVRPLATLDEAMDAAMDAGREAHERGGGLSGISSGLACIDRRIGGLEETHLIVLGARPSVGKTALGLQIGLNASRAGHKVGIISLEMHKVQLGRRTLALASGVDFRAIKSGSYVADPPLAESVVLGRQEMAGLPFLIEDQPGLRMSAIKLRAKMMARRFGGLDLLIVDHLHIVGKSEASSRFGELAALTEITFGLKCLAKEMGLPVLLLAQLNRALEGREDKRPSLADLRGSGSIEQDADTVFFIYRDDYHHATRPLAQRHGERDDEYHDRVTREERHRRENAGRAELIFDKVREGERGVEHLRFDSHRVCFYEEDVR